MQEVKRPLITGVNGKDGSYLAEMLLAKGYELHGVLRRDALEDPAHRLASIAAARNDIRLHVGSLDNHLSIYKIVAVARPDECFHLAYSSFVCYSFEDESSIVANEFNATNALLSSVKELAASCRVYLGGRARCSGTRWPHHRTRRRPAIRGRCTASRSSLRSIWRAIAGSTT